VAIGGFPMALSRSRAILAALILALGSLAATRAGDAAQPPGSNIRVQPHGTPTNVLVRANLTIDMVEPASPSAGQTVRIRYRLRGYVATRGLLIGSAQGQTLTDSAGHAEIPIELAPDQVVSGTMSLRATHAGPAAIRLAYVDRRNCRPRPDGHGGSMTICDTTEIARAEQDLQIAAAPQTHDFDLDGLDDALEDGLLARYRPFYRFSAGEGYRPTDPVWYVRHSELQQDGEQSAPAIVSNSALAADTNAIFVTTSDGGPSRFGACMAPYWLDPDDDYRSGFHDGDGTDWPEILARGNVGLYGHVARDPYQPNLIRIEYWQFYGYNHANVTDVADHEGDWETVVAVVDAADPDRLVEVVHYVHGKPVRFHSFVGNQWTIAATFHGSNYSQAGADLHLNEDADLARAQDSILDLACGGPSVECTHPVVWVELGTHASWPQAGWGFKAAPAHAGDGLSFLTTPPPNLGETHHPRQDTPGADLILNYAGHWGAFSRNLLPWVDTSAAHGPALHGLWARPQVGGPAPNCLE
jgi:uncharacterized Zn-finger protein